MSATKEYSLEKAMDKMAAEWEGVAFVANPYRETAPVPWSVLMRSSRFSTTKSATGMMGSRYIKPMLKRIKHWEHMLKSLQDIIDEDLSCPSHMALS